MSLPTETPQQSGFNKPVFAPVKRAGVIIKTANPRAVGTRFYEFFQWAILWIALNVVPLVALVGLLSLATVGTYTLLGNNLNPTQRLVGSIFIVAVVASFAFVNHKRQQNQ